MAERVVGIGSMDHIKQIQSQAIQRGLTPDTHVYSKLIAFCCTNESGHMEYAPPFE
ncbi:hypothetical protein LguiB_035656 [Lonicera macranthoides]